MSNGGKSVWWRGNAPSWIAAAGAVGLFAVGAITIENFGVREANEALRNEGEGLKKKIADQQGNLTQASSELESLNRQIKDAREDSRQLRQNQSNMLESMKQITANISLQAQNEVELRERLASLQSETGRQSATNRALRGENDRLDRDREQAEVALRGMEEERDRVAAELATTIVSNRRVALRQLVERARNATATPDRPVESARAWTSFLAHLSIGSGFSFRNDEGGSDSGRNKDGNGTISRITTAQAMGIILAQIEGIPPSDQAPFYFQPIATQENGRDLVVSEFRHQTFNVLSEQHRVQLRDDIQAFMDEMKDVFLARISLHPRWDRKLHRLSVLVRTDPRSRYYDEKISLFFPDLESQDDLPPDSEDKLKKLEQDFSNAKEAYEHHLISIFRAREALHEALDRMVAELAPPIGAPNGATAGPGTPD